MSSDLLVILVIAVFFRLCLGYVRLCDRIIGPDPEAAPAPNVTITVPADTSRGNDELEVMS